MRFATKTMFAINLTVAKAVGSSLHSVHHLTCSYTLFMIYRQIHFIIGVIHETCVRAVDPMIIIVGVNQSELVATVAVVE